MSKRSSFGRRENPINLLDEYEYDDDNDSVEFKVRLAEEREEARAAPAAAAAAMVSKKNNMDHQRDQKPSSTTTNKRQRVSTEENDNGDDGLHSPISYDHERPSLIKLFATIQDEQARRNDSTTSNDDPTQRNRLEYCWTMREMLGLDIHPHDTSFHNDRLRSDDIGASASAAPTSRSRSSLTTTTTTPSIDWIVISNYIIDFEVLLQEIPELVSFPNVVMIYGHADNKPPPAACWAHPHAVDLLCRTPADPPQSTHNPLSYRIPYGVHHSKLFLIGYSNGTLRVVIHTANLRYNDIHLKTQGAYLQDFMLKSNDNKNPTSTHPLPRNDFEDTLVSYIGTYGYTKSRVWNPHTSVCTLTQLLRRYDFSTARATLIPSTPGYHALAPDDDTCHLGHLRLRRALAASANDNNQREASATVGVPPPRNRQEQVPSATSKIVCQFSSMGSLTEAWLRELELSMDVNAHSNTKAQKKSGPPPMQQAFHHPYCKLQFVYPTVEEIRASVEGYRGGASVPGSAKNVGKPFLRPLYHKWSRPNKDRNPNKAATATTTPVGDTQDTFQRSRHVPHIKTYYQLTPNGTGMEWFVLTSHNMSKAAWGEVVRSRRHGNEKRLFIRHWELGVLIQGGSKLQSGMPSSDRKAVAESLSNCSLQIIKPVSDTATTKSAESKTTIRIPLPYQLCPEPYGSSSDRPWAVDGVYSVPDVFGQLGC